MVFESNKAIASIYDILVLVLWLQVQLLLVGNSYKIDLNHFDPAMETTNAPQIIEHLYKSTNYTPYDVKWIP